MALADRTRVAGFGITAFVTLFIAVVFATFAARPVAFLAGIPEAVSVVLVIVAAVALVLTLLSSH